MERTLVFVKPDGVQRRLMGKILQRFEEKALTIVGMKFVRLPEDTVRRHYAEHEGKYFYERLVSFVLSGPVLLMAIEGDNAVSVVRNLVGATSGFEAAPGTIRGDFSLSKTFNLIHASDKPESAERELKLFFSADELVEWTPPDDAWVGDDD